MAEKYELGQGYVQIIPSAKGIEGKISAMLDPEAEKAGESAGKKVSEGMSNQLQSGAKKIGKEIGVALAAVATATGKLIKDALSQYGEYEQLTGGVAKLFGDNADAVMKNASDAFKNAQMSANEYMQTVTSFSASLISSLDGDTEKAVGYADMAINDMADNANTFGTSMESIQNAYQGFAKQNYTMLDNLKLGYGGTKSEMERLVEDAEQLNSTFKATRDENGELTLSFADIVDAIHIVQDNMGITGTTAKEASSTIQGSINTLKASWKNFLTGLGDPNADVQALTKNVVDSAKQVIKNVMPIIKNVLKEIPNALSEVWGSLGKGQVTIASLGTAFAGIKIASWASELGLISSPVAAAAGAFVAFGAAVVKWNYDMALAKLEADELYQREQYLTERTKELTEAVSANADAYEQRSAARQASMDANVAEIENVQGLWGELKNLLTTNDELSDSDRARAEFILGQVNTALGTEYDLTSLLTGEKYNLIEAIDQELAARKDAIALQVLEEGYAEAIRNQAAAQEEFNTVTAQRTALEAEANAARAELAAMDAEREANRMATWDTNWQTEYAVLQQRIAAYDEQKIALDASYQESLNTIAGYMADKAMYEDASVAHAQGTFDMETFMSAQTRDAYVADQMARAQGAAAAQSSAYQATLNNLAMELSAITGKKWEFFDAGDGNVLAYADGVAQGSVTSVEEVKSMVADAEAAAEEADFGSVGANAGYAFGDNLGSSAIQSYVSNKARSMAYAAKSAAEAALQIQSPSRVFMRMGEYVGEGFSIGIDKSSEEVVDSMKSMVDDVKGSFESEFTANANTTMGRNIAVNQMGTSMINNSASWLGNLNTSGTDSKIDAVYNLLATFFPQMLEASEKEVVLDGGKLVGSLAPKINTELGKLNTRNSRGGVCTA